MRQKLSYFENIDSAVLDKAMKASPLSLREAAKSLEKTDLAAYTEEEGVLLYIMSAVMKYAWPSEDIDWVVPADLPDNDYTAAVESVKMGVYDTSAGNADFFTLVLPSLLLCAQKDRTGFFSDSKKALDEAASKYKDSVLLHYLYGILNSRMGNDAAALLEYEIAYTLDVSCFETSCAFANALIAADRIEDAKIIADRLYVVNPGNVDVLKLCALTSYNTGDMIAAESFVAQILQREPDNTEYVLFRAKILFNKGEYIKVSSLLDVYAKTNRTNRDYLLLKARLLMIWNKNTTSAASVIQDAISRYPDDEEVILLAASIASETGTMINGKTASELVLPVLRTDPGNPEALRVRVKEAVREEAWEEAYEYSSLLLVSDDSDSSKLLHVETCLNTSRITEASVLVRELYEKNNLDESVLEYYVKVLIAEGNSSQALAIIEKRIPAASSKLKSSLYYERSRLQTSSDRILADLRSSLTSNPRNRNALFALYSYYMDVSDYRKAQYYLKQVLALDPSDQEIVELNSKLDVILSGN
ncbi:MAG: hypothetical protein K5930_12810 [Treponemataceae bacterium]|nr:hypothetical protein [Treponemataceae bacterium]